LRLYGEFLGRTVLRSPNFFGLSFTLGAAATNRMDAARVLESVFAEKAMVTIPDGEKFVMVVPKAQVDTVKPRSATLHSLSNPSPASASTNAPGEELLPPGAFDLRGAKPD
jgi:hypothetical protein